MSINWNMVLSTLTTTGVVVAAIVYMSKKLFEFFLSHDLERKKKELSEELQKGLEKYKSELAEAARLHESKLSADLAKLESALGVDVAAAERARDRHERILYPLWVAVGGLEARLNNVLNDQVYTFLSSSTKPLHNWSMTYDYAMSSTAFLFAQYFCWARVVEERLTRDVVKDADRRNRLMRAIRKVGNTLSTYPVGPLELSFESFNMKRFESGTDRQIFTMQQRAIGEFMTEHATNGSIMVKSFSDFEAARSNGNDQPNPRFAPLFSFLEELNPNDPPRWERIRLMHQALGELKEDCEGILYPKGTPQLGSATI